MRVLNLLALRRIIQLTRYKHLLWYNFSLGYFETWGILGSGILRYGLG